MREKRATLIAIALVAAFAVPGRAGELDPDCLAAADRWSLFVEAELAERAGEARVELINREEMLRHTAAGWGALDPAICQDMLASPDSVLRALAHASIEPYEGDAGERLPLLERFID